MAPSKIQLVHGEVHLDERTVVRPEGTVRLTPTEARLLAFLADRPGEVVEPTRLLGEVWGYRPQVRSRTVVVTIARLRAKIELDPQDPVHLRTVGGGYAFHPRLAHAPSPTFVGRAAPLQHILDQITAGGPGVVVRGPGGIGKTRLAAEVAALARSSGLGVVEVDLGDVTDPREAAERVAWRLGVPGRPAAIASVLEARAPMALVLDDIGPALALVVPLWLDAQRVTRILTSREPVVAPGLDVVVLEPLDAGSARLLLSSTAVRAGADLEALPADALTPLCEALEGLPLALALAGPWLAWLRPEALLRRVDQLCARDGHDGPHGSLARCAARSLEDLGPDDAAALSAWCASDGPLPLEAIERLVSPTPGLALERVARLEARSLVVTSEGGDVRVPRFIRDAVRTRDPSGVSVGSGRLFDWAADVLRLGPDATAWDGGAERTQLVKRALPVLAHAIANAPVGAARALAWTGLVAVLLEIGPTHACVAWIDEAVEASAAGTTASSAAHGVRAMLLSSRGGDPRPGLHAALDACHSPGREARLRVGLGTALSRRGEPDAAREQFARALALNPPPAVHANALCKIGVLELERDLQAGIDLFQLALTIARGGRSESVEIVVLGHLASAQTRLGRWHDAEVSTREAIGRAERLGMERTAAALRCNLGNLALRLGRRSEASRELKSAAAWFNAHGFVSNQADTLLILANVRNAAGQVEPATRLLHEVLHLYRVCSSNAGLGYASRFLGRLAHAGGDPTAALDRYRDASDLLASSGQPHAAANANALAAIALADLGHDERAKASLADATDADPVTLAFARLALHALAAGHPEARTKTRTEVGATWRDPTWA